jgi:hypothetical protein
MDTADTVSSQLDHLSGRSLRIKRWAGDDQNPVAIPHGRSEGSDAFHAAARDADRGRSVRTKITKRRQTVRTKRWAGDDQNPAVPHERSEGSDAFHAAPRVADRGRSVRTNLADQNDSQATTNSQKQHKKHNVWIKRRIGCISGVRGRVV